MVLLLLVLASDAFSLHLQLDREIAHPGEFVSFVGVARGKEGNPVPRGHELVIRGPGGKEYRLRMDASGSHRIGADGEQRVFRAYLRMDPPPGDWKPEPPPLRTAGAWSAFLAVGDVRSREARWRVRTLPAGEVRAKPTRRQREALERFRRRSPAYRSEDADLLWAALREARNDGLAQRVIDVLAKDEIGAANHQLVQHVVWRAASSEQWSGPLQYGIDGPYLPRLAKLVLAAWEKRDRGQAANRNFLEGLDAVVAWVRLHPEESAARARLARLARKSARLVDGQEPRGAGPVPIVKAWRVLLELGELRAGMPVADAIAILGAPNRTREAKAGRAYASWYLHSPKHVNPGLHAEIEDGKVARFRILRG